MRRRATAQENVASHLILDQTYEALSSSTNENYSHAHTLAEDSLEIDGMNTQYVISDLMRYMERKNNSHA